MSVSAPSRSAGWPVDVDQWEWGCGFYSGTEPGRGESGTAADFQACRVEFEAACQPLLPTVTKASFPEWRDQRDWTAPQICDVGAWRAAADPEAEFNNALPVRHTV